MVLENKVLDQFKPGLLNTMRCALTGGFEFATCFEIQESIRGCEWLNWALKEENQMVVQEGMQGVIQIKQALE